MAKNRDLSRLLLLAAVCFCSLFAGPLLADSVVRDQLMEVARGEIGVSERTGRNDGVRVSEYLAYCGLGEGHEWCAAFVSWCFGAVGMPEPRTPWSPALFPAGRVAWRSGLGPGAGLEPGLELEPGGDTGFAGGSAQQPLPGDVFGIWIREKGRIGHAGLVESWDGVWCVTVEGNSGDAVRRMRRPVSTIYRVADWVGGRRKEGR